MHFKITICLILALMFCVTPRVWGFAGTPWINEIHYDNAGVDLDEGVEIAGMAGTDLSVYAIVLYNGSGGASYTPFTQLSGLIDNEGNGGGAIWFPIAGLQNGSPDGLALVNTVTNTVVQFLSYEGSFTATNGIAIGMTSVDIGVSEGTSSAVGASLQLIGSGNAYANFTWTGPVAHSRGSLNAGQTFVGMTGGGNQAPNAGSPRVNVQLPTSGGAACPNAVTVTRLSGAMLMAGDVLAVDDVIIIAGLGVPVPTSAEVSDDNDPDSDLIVNIVSVVITPGQCSTTVAITYSVEDLGGLSSNRTDTFVIVDDTAPAILSAPGSLDTMLLVSGLPPSVLTGPCANDVDLTLLAQSVQTDLNTGFSNTVRPLLASDNCNATNYSVNAAFASGSSSCLALIDLTVIVTDACGNMSAPFAIRLSVSGDTPPVLPANIFINANTSGGANCLNPIAGLTVGAVLVPGTPVTVGGTVVNLPSTASISGCVGPNANFTVLGIAAEPGAGTCSTAYNVDFAFNPDCGSSNSLPFNIEVVLTDDTPPLVVAPSAATISCSADPLNLSLTGTATSSDNCAPILPAIVAMGPIFINEIHYDNIGTDVAEAVEVAGPAGTDLSSYSLVFYNGSNGTVYATLALSGIIPNLGASGYGVINFAGPSGGIQNGAPDGIALCGPAGLIEFLSYEGAFVAVGGCANGAMSTDIGAEEGSSTPVGTSLQRVGTGANGADFSWVAGITATPNAINTGQTFQMPGGGGGMTGGPVPVTFSDVFTPGNCPNNGTIQRTFTATDACGNTATAIQFITIQDDQAPVFAQAPGSLDASLTTSQLVSAGFGACAATLNLQQLQVNIAFAALFNQLPYLGVINVPTATDNCGMANTSISNITLGQIQGAGICSVPILITYRASDQCGSSAEFVQTITVTDNQAPTIAPNFNLSVTLDCSSSIDTSITGNPLFLDNCGSSAAVIPSVWINEFHYDNVGGDINDFVEVAGTAGIDLTGYSIVLYNGSGGASYATMALSGTIPNQGGGGGTAFVSFPNNTIQNGSPDGIALVNATGGVVEFISYEGSMTATNGPAAGMMSTPIPVSEDGNTLATESLQRIGAGSMASAFLWSGPATASPGMLNINQRYVSSQSVTVTFSDQVQTNPNCATGRIITRSFFATDACGNSASPVVQTIVTSDTLAPSYTFFRSDTSVTCSTFPAGVSLASLQAYTNIRGLPVIADNCATGLSANFTDNFAPSLSCPNAGVFTRAFAAVNDGCGNILPARTLTITVADTQAPIYTSFPRDTTVSCNSLTPLVSQTSLTAVANSQGIPTVTDNCTTSLTAPFTDNFSTAVSCPQVVVFTRTFAAIDDGCGNILPARTLTITAIDTSAPQFINLPLSGDIDCTIGLPNPALVSITDCDVNAVLTQVDVVDQLNAQNLGLPGENGVVSVIVRSYTASDACGNSAQTSRVFRILDTQAPILTSCPGDIGPIVANASGTAFVPFAPPAFIDNCAFSVTSDFVSDVFPVGVTQLTYVATDAGGNQTACSFNITVIRPLVIACNQTVDISIENAGDSTRGEINFPYAETTCERCPQGTPMPFLDYLGYFQGHRYYVSKPNAFASWYGAHYFAVELGGRMVEVNDEAENQFIANEIPFAEAYIGLLRESGSSNWRTTFSSEDYRNWAPGSPSSALDRNYAVIRKSDGKHVDVTDLARAYVLEFPCIDFEVLNKPVDSLYGIGPNRITYTAVDQCGFRDTCETFINVTNFDVNYCNPDPLDNFPRERDLLLSGVSVGAYAKTFTPQDIFLQFRDTLELREDEAVALRLNGSMASPQSTDFVAYYRVWVDANRDGDFYDAGEQLFEGLGNAELVGSITLPSSLGMLSPTRLRVAVGRYSYPEPCGKTPFVDFKDFPVKSNTVRVQRLVLKGKAVNGQPELEALVTEDADMVSYLLLRGNTEAQLRKYQYWAALYNDGAKHSYDMVDADPVQRAFYQAVALNAAGEVVTMSNVVEIVLPGRKGGVRVYPNPARDFITIERDVQLELTPEPLEVTMYDALGRRVISREWPADQGQLRLDLPALPSGTYLLQTLAPGAEPEVTRVIIEQGGTAPVPRA